MRVTMRHRLGYLRLRRFGDLFCALLALPFLALAASIQIADAQNSNADTVKIGLIMTYTGQFTDAAAQMDNGIKLYMKQHGDTVAGKKIEIIRKDDGGAPDVAKRLAQDLIVNDNVDILAGFVITPEAMTVADLSAQAKKFMVVMNAATSIVTTKSPYMVRTSLTIAQNCEALGTWAYQNGLESLHLGLGLRAGPRRRIGIPENLHGRGRHGRRGRARAHGESGFFGFRSARQGFRSGRHLRLHSRRLAAGGAGESLGRTRHGSEQNQDHGARRIDRRRRTRRHGRRRDRDLSRRFITTMLTTWRSTGNSLPITMRSSSATRICSRSAAMTACKSSTTR